MLLDLLYIDKSQQINNGDKEAESEIKILQPCQLNKTKFDILYNSVLALCFESSSEGKLS